MKTVLDSMDCPICLDFLQPPIFMCVTGHHICDKCRQKLSIEICPVCKADITNQRNYGLEAIAIKVAKLLYYIIFMNNIYQVFHFQCFKHKLITHVQ